MIFFGVGGGGKRGWRFDALPVQQLVYDSTVRLSIVLLLVQFVC